MTRLKRFTIIVQNNYFTNCTESIRAVRPENRFVMIHEPMSELDCPDLTNLRDIKGLGKYVWPKYDRS